MSWSPNSFAAGLSLKCRSAPLSAADRTVPIRMLHRPSGNSNRETFWWWIGVLVYQGYISDLTRTFAVGDVDDEYHKIHKIVQQANEAGRKSGGPGVPCADVDKAARKVIEDAGYGRFFHPPHRSWYRYGRT